MNIPYLLPTVTSTAQSDSDTFIPTLQEFITIARQGFARKDRFVVSFQTPNVMLSGIPTGSTVGAVPSANSIISKNLSLLCEETTIPGKIINMKVLKINTLNEFRAATTDYLGSSISFSFYVPIDWSVRRFFSDWMSLITGNERHVSDFDVKNADYSNRAVAYYDDYTTSIMITALNPNPSTTKPDVPAYAIRLQEAWPISLHSQNVSYSSTDFHKITVEFAYKWWEPISANTIIDSALLDPKFLQKTTHQPNINLFGIPQILQDIYYGNTKR